MPHRRHLAAALLLLSTVLLSLPAHAWVELHVTGYQARLDVDRQGNARVDQTLQIRLAGGPLRTFDIKIADRNIVLSEEAWLASAQEGITASVPIPARIEQRPDGDLRVEIDGRRGIGRGAYELRFHYSVDLLKQNAVSLDGSMLRLAWTSPRLDDGIDNVQCTFAIPGAPTEPRIATFRVGGVGDEGTSQQTGVFLSTLSRRGETDELSLLRAHVSKAESVTWAARIDPRALGELNDPRLRPLSIDPQANAEIPPRRRALGLGIAAVVGLLYSMLLCLKHRDVKRFCDEHGTVPRPLVPLGVVVRASLSGPLLVIGLLWQMLADNPLGGSVVVLAAVLLSVCAPAPRKTQVRGPGRWLPLMDRDAFRSSPRRGSWLDASTSSGGIVLAIVILALSVGVGVLYQMSPYHAYLAAFDFVVPLGLFGTGLRRWLSREGPGCSSPLLSKIAEQLRKDTGLRVAAVGRFPCGSRTADEVRLLIRPKTAQPGLIAIEVGIGWYHGFGGSISVPEVLARVAENSLCHDAITAEVRAARWMRGRDTQERVVTLIPDLPTCDGLVDLVRSLCKRLARPTAVT